MRFVFVKDFNEVLMVKKLCNIKCIDFNRDAEYIAIYEKEVLVSLISIAKKKDGYHFSSNYTRPEYRGKGYMSKLLQFAMQIYDPPYVAYCLDSSVNIYLKNGFELVKTYQRKSYRCHYVRRKDK